MNRPGVPARRRWPIVQAARAVAGTLVGIGLVFALPYALAPVYHFPAAQPFAGPFLFNPYAGSPGVWYSANLRARAPVAGYDIVAVAANQSLGVMPAGDSNYIPVYEQGFNRGRAHRLAIGAQSVLWLDFPFGQSTSQTQYLIDRVAQTADLVAIPHPLDRGELAARQMGELTTYDLLEVLDRGRVADTLWDAALSAGRLVWILASDDSAGLVAADSTAAWTMIEAPSTQRADVVTALGTGRSYGVLGTRGRETHLADIEVRGDTLVVSTDAPMARFAFIGQGGAVRDARYAPGTARYVFRANDSYIRTVITTRWSSLYLNPVVRTDKTALPRARAEFDQRETWFWRVIAVSALAGAAVALYLAAKRAIDAVARPSGPQLVRSA